MYARRSARILVWTRATTEQLYIRHVDSGCGSVSLHKPINIRFHPRTPEAAPSLAAMNPEAPLWEKGGEFRFVSMGTPRESRIPPWRLEAWPWLPGGRAGGTHMAVC
jgi:hypothetical protein